MNGLKFASKALRQGKHGRVEVVGFRVAEQSSVLAGQTLTHFLDSYDSEALARAEHPDVTGWVNKWTQPQVSLAHLPSEDDYVPGGALPDDLFS